MGFKKVGKGTKRDKKGNEIPKTLGNYENFHVP